MIMKKFEQLEKVMKETENVQIEPSSQTEREELPPKTETAAESSHLTEDRLEKIFEATSAFAVRDAFRSDGYVIGDSDVSDIGSVSSKNIHFGWIGFQGLSK